MGERIPSADKLISPAADPPGAGGEFVRARFQLVRIERHIFIAGKLNMPIAALAENDLV